MRRGMTLVEVVLAIGILISLLALGAPWMLWMLDKSSLQTCAERMGTMLQMARLSAMTEGTRYRLRYDEDTARWKLQRKRLASEKKDESRDAEEEEPEQESGDDEVGFDSQDEPGYLTAPQPWAELDRFLGNRIWIRWIMSTAAYRRLEAEEPGQTIFTGGEEEDRLTTVVLEPDGTSENFVILIEQSPTPVTKEQRETVEIDEEDEPEEGEIDKAYLRRLIFFDGMTGKVTIVRPQTAKERAELVEVGEPGKPPTYTPREGVWGNQ